MSISQLKTAFESATGLQISEVELQKRLDLLLIAAITNTSGGSGGLTQAETTQAVEDGILRTDILAELSDVKNSVINGEDNLIGLINSIYFRPNGTSGAFRVADANIGLIAARTLNQTIATGGTAQQVFETNPNRRYIALQNLSSGDLWIDINRVAVIDQCIKVLPNGYYETPSKAIPSFGLSVIAATTGQSFVVMEG
ncbi:MAG: hypothetical protein DDT31_00223 [Syntrophomonadaceae bacterium]|nr:hypothetical protein [Bacillota bacterium]